MLSASPGEAEKPSDENTNKPTKIPSLNAAVVLLQRLIITTTSATYACHQLKQYTVNTDLAKVMLMYSIYNWLSCCIPTLQSGSFAKQ